MFIRMFEGEESSRGATVLFVLSILTSPVDKVTLEGEAWVHMAGGSKANRCPAGLTTKTGQCFRLVAKTGTNRFLKAANLFPRLLDNYCSSFFLFLTSNSTSAKNTVRRQQ